MYCHWTYSLNNDVPWTLIGGPELAGFSTIVTEAARAGFTRKSAIRSPLRGHSPERRRSRVECDC
jgi:hypothetical protein